MELSRPLMRANLDQILRKATQMTRKKNCALNAKCTISHNVFFVTSNTSLKTNETHLLWVSFVLVFCWAPKRNMIRYVTMISQCNQKKRLTCKTRCGIVVNRMSVTGLKALVYGCYKGVNCNTSIQLTRPACLAQQNAM